MRDRSKNKLRVLFTIPNFITAGSGKAVLAVIERLDRSRFDPAVCVARKGGSLDRRVDSLGVPFLELPFTTEARPLHRLLGNVRAAARPFKQHGFDVWHSYHYLDDYTEPLIARFSGARAWVYTKKNMNWRGRAWKLRSLLAKGIAVQNNDMLSDFFSSRLFEHKTSLVPPGVDVDTYRTDKDAGVAVRRELCIDDGEMVIGCLANLTPVKGISTLIEALANLDCRLVVAGARHDEVYVESLEQQARDLGVSDRVHLVGHRSDVPAFLASLDVFCFPSRHEGCPVSLLEAMAAGKACVGTDVPGVRDVIEHERSGLLVPSEDSRALTVALQRLLTDPERRLMLGESARDRVRAQFSLDAEVARLQGLYERVLVGE